MEAAADKGATVISPRDICKSRECRDLSTSGNFCLKGWDPCTCTAESLMDGTKPQIKCGKCGLVAPYSDFKYGTSRAALRHPDLRYCPACGHCIDHPVRAEKDGRIYHKPGYTQVKEAI